MRLSTSLAAMRAALSLFLLQFVTFTNAAPVDEERAQRVATNIVRQHIETFGDWAGSSNAAIASLASINHRGSKVAYLARVHPSGLVLVSVDDDLPPLIAYALSGNFDESRISTPQSFESWIIPEAASRYEEIVQQREVMLKSANRSMLEQVRLESEVGKAWQSLDVDPQVFVPVKQGAELRDGYKATRVGPVLATTWDQGFDNSRSDLRLTYNAQTPPGPTCEATLTGCVATALGQIMRYWRWPDAGEGTASYFWTRGRSTVSRSFGQRYDWASMPRALVGTTGSTSASTTEQIASVAHLLSDVGVAVSMQYGCSSDGGSSASTLSAFVLPQYFKYRSTIQEVHRGTVGATAFFNAMKAELDATPPRPVFFTMQSASGGTGHAVVVDGYVQDISNKVSINMGWGGSFNAFYDVTVDWATGGNRWSALSQRAYIGIQPDSTRGPAPQPPLPSRCSYKVENGVDMSADGKSPLVFDLVTEPGCEWTISEFNSAFPPPPTLSFNPSRGVGRTRVSVNRLPFGNARTTENRGIEPARLILYITTAGRAQEGLTAIFYQPSIVQENCAFQFSNLGEVPLSGGTANIFVQTSGPDCLWEVLARQTTNPSGLPHPPVEVSGVKYNATQIRGSGSALFNIPRSSVPQEYTYYLMSGRGSAFSSAAKDRGNITIRQVDACSKLLSTPSDVVVGPGAAQNISVDVSNLDSNCTWSAISQSSWITVLQGGGPAAGNRSVRLSVTANPTAGIREGTIKLGPRTLSVKQWGTSVPKSVFDGGFESSSGSWQLDGYAAVRSDPTQSFLGYGFLSLGTHTSGGGRGVARQLFEVPPGTSRKLTFLYRAEWGPARDKPGVTAPYLFVRLLGPNGARLASEGFNLIGSFGGWEPYSISLPEPAPSQIFVEFEAGGEGAIFFLDDVYFSSIGAPLVTGSIDFDGRRVGEMVLQRTGGTLSRLAIPNVNSGQLEGVAVTEVTLGAVGTSERAAAVVDLNNDGRSDLVVQATSGAGVDSGLVTLLRGGSRIGATSLRSVRSLWRVEASGDLDGDGRGDLVWRYTGTTENPADTGVSYVWFTDGQSVTQVRKRGGAPLSWRILGAADVNRDGAADLFYLSPNNEIRILVATSQRTCANFGGGSLLPSQEALAVGSFSGAGRAELLVRSRTDGSLSLIRYDHDSLVLPAYTGRPDDQNASCTSTNGAEILSVELPFSRVDLAQHEFVALADFNGDGLSDSVWRDVGGLLRVVLSSGMQNDWTTGRLEIKASSIGTTYRMPQGATAVK